MEYSEIKSMMEREVDIGRFWKKVLKTMECPICFDYFEDNTVLCDNGHTICENCIEVDPSEPCPICREPLGKDARNIALEDIAKELKKYLEKYPGFDNDTSNDISKLFDIHSNMMLKLLEENEDKNANLINELEQCKFNLEITNLKLVTNVEIHQATKEQLNKMRKKNFNLIKKLKQLQKENEWLTIQNDKEMPVYGTVEPMNKFIELSDTDSNGALEKVTKKKQRMKRKKKLVNDSIGVDDSIGTAEKVTKKKNRRKRKKKRINKINTCDNHLKLQEF